MYSLCALLSRADDLGRRLTETPGARVIGLEQGFGMVPLTEQLLRQIQWKWSDAVESSRVAGVFEFLTPPIESWLQSLSPGIAIAYVETEYFGGEGFERAAVWRDAEIELGPLEGAGAVNRALKALGVSARPGQEEFDSIGLGRHRSLEEWLSEA